MVFDLVGVEEELWWFIVVLLWGVDLFCVLLEREELLVNFNFCLNNLNIFLKFELIILRIGVGLILEVVDWGGGGIVGMVFCVLVNFFVNCFICLMLLSGVVCDEVNNLLVWCNFGDVGRIGEKKIDWLVVLLLLDDEGNWWGEEDDCIIGFKIIWN